MTTMADDIYVANLPPGYGAYAGYVDGEWATFSALKARFPASPLLSIAVFASSDADCLDIESGDATIPQAAPWVKAQLGAGASRPCLYSSVSNMNELVTSLQAAGISRSAVRLWAAHYGAGAHICGPYSCKLMSAAADGTQWTDTATGLSGSQIDASVLAPNFFGGETSMTIPGVPGQWTTAEQFYAPASKTAYVVGVGTNGLVYMTKSVNGAAWTSPVVL